MPARPSSEDKMGAKDKVGKWIRQIDGKLTVGSVFQSGETEHLGWDANFESAGAHCNEIYFT